MDADEREFDRMNMIYRIVEHAGATGTHGRKRTRKNAKSDGDLGLTRYGRGRTGNRTCKPVEKDEHHNKGPRSSWTRNQMGNPDLHCRFEGGDWRWKTMLKARPHKASSRAIVSLLAGMWVFAGCVSFPDMGALLDRTIMLPVTTSGQFANAACDYYECSGRWPTSVEDLRSLECKDAGKMREVSNILAGIAWESLTNQVVFKTTPDGKLTISMTFIGGTATTNGQSLSWNGGEVTATVGVPKYSKDGADSRTVNVQFSPKN
jgi:hypothetical protein